LISRYCDRDTLYIATDISFQALKLNRSRNTHNNSVYVVCSADSLPFREGAIDVLCYFGILHHTEGKTDLIPPHSRLVKKGGYILIHEPLDRPSLLGERGPHKAAGSPREGRVGKRELLAKVASAHDLSVIASQEIHGLFFAGMMRFFRAMMMRNKPIFRLVSDLDILLARVFGGAVPFLKPGAIMLLLRKSTL
jgi:ubiquinone/menaquinone biosynthesis C-methylase UbiE